MDFTTILLVMTVGAVALVGGFALLANRAQKAELAAQREREALLAKQAQVAAEESAAAAIKVREAQKELEDSVLEYLKPYRGALARKANQTIYKNDYGRYIFDKWNAEVSQFLETVLYRDAPELRHQLGESWIRQAVDDVALSDSDETDETPASLPGDLTPKDFEALCADLARSAGWEARLTRATGDQGVDVVATAGRLRAVLQCKLLSRPVGNAAVQEIIAGRQFEAASIAAVVSNASFTTSARALAATADVALLHFSELAPFLTDHLRRVRGDA